MEMCNVSIIILNTVCSTSAAAPVRDPLGLFGGARTGDVNLILERWNGIRWVTLSVIAITGSKRLRQLAQ